MGITETRTVKQSSPWTSKSLRVRIIAAAVTEVASMYEHARLTPTTDDDTPEKQSSPSLAQSHTMLESDEAN
jgi:hypothetical protein